MKKMNSTDIIYNLSKKREKHIKIYHLPQLLNPMGFKQILTLRKVKLLLKRKI
jgi:hypothetical protein